jgi:hypothetical protein
MRMREGRRGTGEGGWVREGREREGREMNNKVQQRHITSRVSLTGVVCIISVPASDRSACHSAHEVFAIGRSAHCHCAQISPVTPPVYTHLEGEENCVLFFICCTAINYFIVLLLHCFVESICLNRLIGILFA